MEQLNSEDRDLANRRRFQIGGQVPLQQLIPAPSIVLIGMLFNAATEDLIQQAAQGRPDRVHGRDGRNPASCCIKGSPEGTYRGRKPSYDRGSLMWLSECSSGWRFGDLEGHGSLPTDHHSHQKQLHYRLGEFDHLLLTQQFKGRKRLLGDDFGPRADGLRGMPHGIDPYRQV